MNWKIRKDLERQSRAWPTTISRISGADCRIRLFRSTASDQGNTDDTRPAFAQKGNTYIPLRDIVPVPENNFGTTRQFQYFGLASPFRDVAFTGTLHWGHYDPIHVWLTGEWIRNTAFNWNSIDEIAVNNRGPNQPIGQPGRFDGGDTAWLVNLKFGMPRSRNAGTGTPESTIATSNPTRWWTVSTIPTSASAART